MDARMVYPTAPFDTQAQHPNVDIPPTHTGAGENVESPGKAMAVLSKVKNKAKKLRSRIKKVTGSNTSGTGHGDNVNEHGMRDFNRVPGPHDEKFDDDEAESYDEEEEEDFHKSNKNEFRYEQLRSIGALDNQGDGSEVEVHGGVPVPARADDTGSYWKRADDGEPISTYKSAGPPGALQATPTEYRYYAADDDIPLKEGVPANRKREAPLEESARSGGNFSARSGPEFKPDVEAANRFYDEPVQPHSKYDGSNVSVSGADISHPESLATSKQSYEDSSALSSVEAPLEETGRSGENLFATSRPEFKPDIEASNRSYGEPVEPQSKSEASDVSASGTHVPHPQSLASSNLSAGESSAPPYNKIAVMEEDLSADRKLGVGLPSDEHAESGEGNALETSALESDPEGRRLNLFDAELGESESKDGVLGTGGTSASDIDVPYPGDLVKPNPSFGQSSSPTRDKIAVLNNEASPDEKLGLGLSTGEQSGSGKRNLLETAVPEGEELSGYQKGGDSLIPLEADELVYRPVSESEEGSTLTSPPGKLEGAVYGRSTDLQESGAGSPFQDKSARQSEMWSEEDLPTSEVNSTASKAEDDIPSNYGEQKRSFDVASEVFDTAGDGSSENWGKWSADKINNAENVTVSSLVASDLRSDGETQDNSRDKAVDAIGTTDKVPDKVPESENVDMVKPPAGEDVNQDSEEEYYDPNEVKDDQFEQGFALGNAEEDALSGTLAGSAIETLQGLKDTFQSSLGYSNRDTSDAGGEGKPGPVEGEERNISPSSSQQQQKGGFVQGLRQSVASSLGYGKTGPEEEVVQDTDVLERGESDVEGKDKSGPIEGQERTPSPSSSQLQQKGGFVQGLRQSVASSLGYGKTAPEEVVQDTDALERRDSDVGGEGKRGPVEGEEKTLLPSSSQQQQKGGFVQGLNQSVASSLGYGKTDPEEVGQDTHVSERAVEPETEFDSRQEPAGGTEQVEEKAHSPSSSQPLSPGSSQQQQKGGFVQGLTQAVASSLGYGKAGSSEESGQITDALERGRESESDIDSRPQQSHGAEDVEERALSPGGSQEHQVGGFVEDPKETAAPPLGYGEAASDKVGNNNGGLDRGGEQVEKARSPSGSQLLSPGSSQQQQKGGFVQGLKQTVASSLGYGKAVPGEEVVQNSDSSDSLEKGRGLETELDRGSESETDLDCRQQPPVGTEESEGRVFSPSGSQEHQKGGSVEELKQKAASPLGYDEAVSDNDGDNNDVLEKGGTSETDFDNGRQQSPGTYQALKNALASKLGYGGASGEQSPIAKTKTESREQSADLERSEPPHNKEGETNDSGIKPGLVLNDAKENAGKVEEIPEASPRSPESGTKPGLVLNDAKETPQRAEEEIPEPSPRSGGILQGLKDRFTSTLGYNSQPAETHRDVPHTESEPEPEPESVLEPEPEPEPQPQPKPHAEPEPVSEPVSSPGADVPPSSYTQKLMGTTAGARNYLASKIGYGSKNEEVVEKNIGDGHDGDKSTSPSPHVDSIYNE